MTSVDVDTFAKGDGKTDDTLAIRQAIATGKHLRFSPGKTYLYSGQLALSPGQIVFGNGATLKRRAQVRTTTNTPIASGQTKTIQVADASGLAVGMDITLVLDSQTSEVHNHTIFSIDGNSVTVITPFELNTSGQTVTVYSSHLGWWLFDDCRVYDVVMDGNRSAYSYYHWEVTREFRMQGNRSLISGCLMRDAPGEGVYMERDFITVTDCTILNCNGNGVHLGASNRSVIDRVRVVGANLDTAVGHADGCICLSAVIDHLTISNCHLENGLSGVGSWDTSDNSNLSIVGNTIVGCSVSASEGLGGSDPPPTNVLIAKNRIYDSHALFVRPGWAGASAPQKVLVRDNYFRNTRIEVGGQFIEVTGNIIESSTDSTATQIDVAGGKHVKVRGNTVVGGRVGVSVDGASEDVLVAGNSLSGQTQAALLMGSAGVVNCLAVGNQVTGGAGASAGYRAITVSGREVARDNLVNLTQGEAGIFASSGAIVKNNLVRAGSATYTIRTAAGSSGVLVKDNEVTAPVSNGGDATNVEVGTVVVAS